MKHVTLHTLLLAGACAATLAPAMAADADAISGYGEIFAGMGYGATSSDARAYQNGSLSAASGGHDQHDISLVGGSAHANIPLEGGFGVQVDVEGQNDSFGDATTSADGFGLHLYKRDAFGLIGAFASVGSTQDSRLVTAGLDGKLYLDTFGLNDVSLDAQASYTAAVQGDLRPQRADSWNLYAGANYFYNDHLSFSGGIGAAFLQSRYRDEALVHQNVNRVNWNLRTEYLMHDMPLGVFASYQGAYNAGHYKMYDGDDLTAIRSKGPGNVFMLGLRVYFGQNSLKDNDRTGASLTDANPWYGAQALL